MQYISPDIKALFEQAVQYEQAGDPYNSIKLYKRVIKMAGEWPEPYFRLGVIYKYRREWKPALHYHKKNVALAPGNQTAWWNIGIAATALKKWRLARNVWSKFGYQNNRDGFISVRIAYSHQFEILGAQMLDPARARIENIPHPASGHRYKDILLFDGDISGYHIADRRKLPVFDELGLFKRSIYRTYSCLLHRVTPKDINTLEALCRESSLGFEVWSNATRVFSTSQAVRLPEYYGPGMIDREPPGSVHVALAARREREVWEVLKAWKVISLGDYSDLECHL